MAAPITHILLSEKTFNNHFSNLLKDKFFVGTSFPDIRYLKVIERDKTHTKDVSLEKIKTAGDFQAGLLFHSLVDNAREKFVQDNNIYDIIPKSKFLGRSLKLFEDEIFYNEIKNWPEIISYLNNVLEDEINFSINEADIEKWHNMLKDYFSQPPSSNSRRRFFKILNFEDADIEEMEENIDRMKENTGLKNKIKEFYEYFENLLTN